MCSHAFMVHGPLPRMHPFQPRNFFGGQSSGPAGSDPGSFDQKQTRRCTRGHGSATPIQTFVKSETW